MNPLRGIMINTNSAAMQHLFQDEVVDRQKRWFFKVEVVLLLEILPPENTRKSQKLISDKLN